MKKFEYNSYEILIDDFETSKRFNETKIIENQEYRNFQKYVDEKMTDEEKAFFASLCIDLKSLNVERAYYSKKKEWNAVFKVYIIGEFTAYPQFEFKTIEDVMKNGFDVHGDIEDNDITIGHFNIHILTPEEIYSKSNYGENEIEIEIFADDLPWLLDEKCNHKAPKSPSKIMAYLIEHYPEFTMHLVESRFYVPKLISEFKENRRIKKNLFNALEGLKNDFSINYKILSDKEVLEYKKQWVKSFLPVGTDEELQKKAYDLCVENKKCSTFLWHIFSFGIIESEENPTEKFDSINKKNCTLLFETGLKDIAINMSNAERVKERDIVKLCENVTGWSDFVITANDFSWTYSRTHEDGWCGPYFYKKNCNIH